MGSVKSKKFTPRRGKAYQRRRYAGKARTTRKWDKGSLDKYVQSKVDRAMKRASRSEKKRNDDMQNACGRTPDAILR